MVTLKLAAFFVAQVEADIFYILGASLHPKATSVKVSFNIKLT